MNVALEIAKVVATIGRELGKMCLSGDCQQAEPDGMAAVAASGGGSTAASLGNTKLTTELTITVVKADAAEARA